MSQLFESPNGRLRWRATQARRNALKYDRMEHEAAAETLTVHVASESDPNVTYTLHAQGDTATCSCRGWSTHKHCKHSDALMRVLKEKRDGL